METTGELAANVRLRPATPADDEFLVAVYATTRAEEMDLVPWDEAQKAAFVRSQYDLQQQQYFERFPDSKRQVVLLGDEPVGRFWTVQLPEQIRLLDIAILPSHQGRGIGGELFRRLITVSEEARVPLRHMVFKLNPRARVFYERLGFREIEEYHMYTHLERRPASELIVSGPADD